MSSFASASFSTADFSALSFDFDGNGPPPAPTVFTQGYMSGSYVTRMSEAEFERRRAVFKTDLDGMIYRMTGEKAKDEMLAAMEAVSKAKSFAQKREREKRLSDMIDREILAAHEAEAQRVAYEKRLEAEDEEIVLNYLLQ